MTSPDDSLATNPSPEVSVCIITYNQADYIKECLMSVFAQEHSFSMEIIVADDGSTDGTQEILVDLAQGRNIKLILSSQNGGVKNNLYAALTAANGSYIALLEGDDYWVNRNKLFLQISRMRADERISLSYTSALTEVKMFGVKKIYKQKALDPDFIKDIRRHLWKGWFGLHTCTLVMTSNFLNRHLNSDFFNKSLISGDWPIAMQGSIIGKIDYLDVHSACYRVAPGSIMNSGIASRLNLIKEWIEWWKIFSHHNADCTLSSEEINHKTVAKMKELGFVQSSSKSADVTFAGIGSFKKVKSLVLLHKFRRQGYLFKRWILGDWKI